MKNFNERTNTFFIKNIISHTLFSKRWCWLCVRGELETGTDCYFDPSPSDHSSTFFSSSWLCCSTVSHWGPKALCLPLALNSTSCPQLTQTVWHLVILLSHAHLLSLFFRLSTQVHLLIDGSVDGQYITLDGLHTYIFYLVEKSILFFKWINKKRVVFLVSIRQIQMQLTTWKSE